VAPGVLIRVASPQAELLVGGMRLDPVMTFDTMITGGSNAVAIELVRQAIDARRDGANPVLVVGPSGCGKSHLLQAAANEVLRRHPQARVVMRSAAALAEEYVCAIRSGSVREFEHALTDCDALLVDGLEDLARRPATQAEVGTVIEWLLDRGRPVLLSAVRIDGLGSLQPLLRRGKRAALRRPALDERVRALRSVLQAEHAEVSTARLERLARRAATIAEARAVLHRVLERQRLSERHRRAKARGRSDALTSRELLGLRRETFSAAHARRGALS
jgi:chromosomal replication initiator protein